MKTLLTQKTYYLLWIAGLLCLVLGIVKSEEMISYQMHDTFIVFKFVQFVGVVAFFLFLLGLGYYIVIKTKESVPLGLTILQLMSTFLLCYVLLFTLDLKQYDEPSEMELAQPRDLLILFIVTMLLYSINLGWALLRKQKQE